MTSFELTGNPSTATYGSYTFELKITNSQGSLSDARTLRLDADPTILNFTDNIFPILQDKCGDCHIAVPAPSLASAITAFPVEVTPTTSSYDEVFDRINTIGSPTSSLLFEKASIVPGSSHFGGKPIPVTSTEYGTILQWINEGAIETAP